MSDPFIGQITLFAFNFAPRGWAFCDGQLLQISQNTALFSLLGTTYGGDGQVTFGLPNLQGRLPMHAGHGAGLTPRTLGETGGAPSATLNINQIPSHGHDVTVNVTNREGDSSDPSQRIFAKLDDPVEPYGVNSSGNLGAEAIDIHNVGGSQPHDNHQPFLSMYFSIALFGIYPSRD
jgi:microcystin-dependent protein